MTKEEFYKDIAEITLDKLFITNSVDHVDEEIKNNCWSISMTNDLANKFSVDELKVFLKEVKENRKEQLTKSKNGVGLIYYI